ncbi:hypothetical protein ASF61_07190 [Duganella sp. Leaf126]|uniref:serine/threonine-protein kinase n=1 Tax=Duganella sp. Leaf126 TaxID=1736266 RepID=UPI000712C5B5|nr:serine/threonine-protein kinase [Duganella sp. Leaf126]KQQ35994.1 hypothetical protein ASF61_07190 [Duganella sp. Leaf126]
MLDDQAAPATLDRFGRYLLERSLGEGGFGRVFEAWDPTLQRKVALKCLKVASGHGAADALIDEARCAASLQHRAFVRVFAFEEHAHSQAIVMELVPGATLRASLPAGGMAPALALEIVDQVAEAMAEAHRAGLIHGDIKPTNLMREPSGAVRILDFGLARKIDPLATDVTAAQDSAATVAYTAPERLMACPLTRASDIYSLGVVLYEMLTGERPFANLTGLALAAAHVHTTSDSWPFPVSTDRSLVELVRKMTAHDPASRLASMEAVRERIAVLRGVASAAHTPSPQQQQQPAQGAPAPPSGSASAAAAGATMAAPAPANLPAAAGEARSLRARWRRPLAIVLGAGVLLAVALAAVQLPPPETWQRTLAPFSTAAAMAAGMEQLGQADRDGALEQALQHFQAILARDPQHAGAAAGASVAYSLRYIGDGRDESWLRFAAAGAQAALLHDDQLALAHAAQAWVLALQGHAPEALAVADRALALDPRDLSALNAKLNVLLRQRRFDALAAALAQAQRSMPGERMFYDLEGTMHYQQGDYVRAEQAFRHSLQLAPDAVLAYANLSAALGRQGRSDDALAMLQQGLRLRPSGKLYTNLGDALFRRGDYAGAARAFEQAASAARGGPGDYLKWANLADTLAWIPGRADEAQAAYKRAIRLLTPLLERSPDDATFLSRMGLYLAHVHDAAAADAIARSVARAPDSADVRFRAAVASELAGRRALALTHIGRALRAGYPARLLEAEPQLIALRRDPRYPTTVEENTR